MPFPATAHLEHFYRSGFALMTDLYQLTMAYGYWKSDMAERQAVFHLFFWKSPFGQPYAIAAGAALLADYLNRFRFTAEDVQYLGRLTGSNDQPLFSESFLNYLQRLQLTVEVDAVREGSVVFPNTPLVRVTGPLLQCQLLETILLNLVNFSTLIATKTARIVQAARGDSVLEFGFRRAQGIDGALTGARAAYIGGCHATSNVLAGRLFGIPVKGTHAHSWVMCFEDEITAFRQYARVLPHNSIFLVDTYDTIQGVHNAVTVGKEMREQGYEMTGIRLDSGDLAELSKRARGILDEGGFPEAAIVASNELDEYAIAQLKDSGAPIAIWGVGTRLATAYDQPALGGVYKLAAIQGPDGQWQNRLKLSETEAKTSIPGMQQVRRFVGPEGRPMGDMIFLDRSAPPQPEMHHLKTGNFLTFGEYRSQDLLQPVFRPEQEAFANPELHAIRQYSQDQQALFREIEASEYPVGLERNLWALRQELIEQRRS